MVYSLSSLLSSWQLNTRDGHRRSNEDMDPVPLKQRTWTTWNYVAYWISDSINPTIWEIASSMVAIGLSWQQALLAISVGHILIAVVISLNGTMGAQLHIPFPVIARASFGFWFSVFCVTCRMSIAMFWFGIVSFNGSECTFQMVKALWPSFADVPNQLPASAGITSVGMISYVLFWAIQFPFLLVSPRDIRYFFVVKAVLAPATCLGMLIWAIMRVSPATSLGPGSKLHENHAPFWVWLSAMTSATGAWSTLAINIPDFTRYAVDERAQFIQILVIPMFMTLVGFCGIVVASTTDVLYGTIIWDPLRVIDRWDSRPAKFFAAFSFTMAVLGTNISANSLSAANDLTVLFPRYVNIRRGQVICAIVGCWVICPWKILASAPGFLNFISAYAVFLAPLASILVVDYWIVRKRRVDLIEIYLPEGRYRYWHGINWRAVLAFVVGLGPNIPGLVATLDPTIIVGRPLLKVYDVAWLYGTISTAFAYWLFWVWFPANETLLDGDNCGGATA